MSKKTQAKKTTKPTTARKSAATAKAAGSDEAQRIDERTRNVGDWRGETLARARALILVADPEMSEEVKWRKPSNNMQGVPVWSHNGIVCTGETYKSVVKLTFAQGASLPDPARLFNASLEGNTRRAIDLHEGEQLNEKAFRALIQAAVAHNLPSAQPAAAKGQPKAKSAQMSKLQVNENGAVLLSGGNPQIAKADGDAPVQAYIAAMPGWKRSVGKRLDDIIVQNVPNVRKAVRWNSPFYGSPGQGWFVTFHVFSRYVKLTFFDGVSLHPLPPGVGKDKKARWIDIYEDDELNEAQLAAWMKQAAALPGWAP